MSHLRFNESSIQGAVLFVIFSFEWLLIDAREFIFVVEWLILTDLSNLHSNEAMTLFALFSAEFESKNFNSF